jgi:hypothetical protein
MKDLGLVLVKKVGRAIVCTWNEESPEAEALGSILGKPEKGDGSSRSEDTVYWNLRRMGAPLTKRGSKGEVLSPEDTLSYALILARKYPEVARIWPVLFATHRAKLDLETLRRVAHRLGQKRSLGFFMDLTQVLLGDPRRAGPKKAVRDRRFRKTEDFFRGESSKRAQELADLRTPRVAKNWHFRMNMPLESFKSAFDKFGARPS